MVAVRGLAPQVWYRWVPGAREDRVVPPPPSTVSISDPTPPVVVTPEAGVVDVPTVVDVGHAAHDAGPAVVAATVDAGPATELDAAVTIDAAGAVEDDGLTARARRRRRRHELEQGQE